MQRLALSLVAALLIGVAADAHHGSADYDVAREIAVSGVLHEWRWTQPHTWVVVSVTAAEKTERWDGEGPPLVWAQARGWSLQTLKSGERVTLVMYPSRRRPRSGLIKRIQRANGDPLVVSRPWLDR
jgi:hypothetical protein